MTLPPILTPFYWIKTSPPPFMPAVQLGLLILFAVCVAAGIAVYLMRRKTGLDKLSRRGLARIGTAAITMGVCGLALWFFDYERISILSMRAFYLAWIIVAAAWGFSIYRYIAVQIPKIRQEREEKENFNKWLPKAKA